jgi:hypothetical protein
MVFYPNFINFLLLKEMDKWQTVIRCHLKRAVLVKEARKTNLVTKKLGIARSVLT